MQSQQILQRYLGGIGEKDEIHVDTMTTLDDEDMSNYGTANQMKMTAYIAAGDVDVLLLNQSAYDKYDGSGAFADLSTLLTKEQLEQWSDLLVYGEIERQTESGAESASSDRGRDISGTGKYSCRDFSGYSRTGG